MALNGMRNTQSITLSSVGFPVDPIEDIDVPANYRIGEFFDVRIKFRSPMLGWHQRNTTEIWVFEGADLGIPETYVWDSATPPDFSEPVPEDLSDTDWVLLATPPANLQGEWFDANRNWQGDWGKYFLMRFGPIPVGTTGIRIAKLKENGLLYYARLDENEPEHYTVGS